MSITRITGQKSRDAIVRAVRLLAPVEDPSSVANVTLSRATCPALRHDTWGEIAGYLPIGWSVVALHEKEFVVAVQGRRAS